jgi:hypothetical protein
VKRPTTHLRLFRSPNGDPQHPRYTGTLLVPGVPPTAYNVQAWVEEQDAGDGTGTRKCLCGFISGGQEVKGGKAAELKGPASGDLLAPLEKLPFDDPLPEKPF